MTERLAKLDGELPVRDYYSHTTYYRLFIPDMYPQYDKAIYIDSDTITIGDISKLYEQNIDGYYVAGVRDQVVIQDETFGEYVEKVLGLDRHAYFNAGMLLMNCKVFREENLLQKFIQLLNTYTFVVAQDQDYLNIIVRIRYYGWMHHGIQKYLVSCPVRKRIFRFFIIIWHPSHGIMKASAYPSISGNMHR